jgi:hypothetical protein
LQNRVREAKKGGVHRIGIAWICNILSIIGGYFIYFRLNNQPEVVYDTLFELHYYEIAGRVSMMVILSIIYLIAFTIYGDKETFEKSIMEFLKKTPEQQEKIANRASRYFNYSLLLFLIIIGVIVYLFKL